MGTDERWGLVSDERSCQHLQALAANFVVKSPAEVSLSEVHCTPQWVRLPLPRRQ